MRVEPFDEHNQALVRNVRPPDWMQPSPKGRYHLVVIGAGAGGLVSSAIAGTLGARVALIERALLGGDCLNVGCVPSKAVLRAARAWHDARRAGERFGGPAAEEHGDFARAMERMRRLRARISAADSAERFRRMGVDVFLGDSRFTGPQAVEVDGRTLRFRRAIIAAGGRPAVPPVPGLEDAGYLTNETVFSLTELPPRLIVVGAGPIGCELAQAFARFGSRVVLLDMADRVLPREDEDASRLVYRALVEDGVECQLGVRMDRVERHGGERVVRYRRADLEASVAAESLLIAAGRAPNVEGLGLEAAGVETGRSGIVVGASLRTSNRRVYAVGDIASRYQFTHASDAEAQIAVQNALFFRRKRATRLVMPWCTYTSPEVAHVGLYEHEARKAGFETDTITVPLAENDRAVLDGAEEGFLRLHLRAGSDRILGATLVCERAGELIAEATLAMTHGLGLGAIGTTIHPYPTQGDLYRRAYSEWRRGKLTPGARRLFRIFFGIFR